MAGLLITSILSLGMLTAIWLLLVPRPSRRAVRPQVEAPESGLTADDRRRLYEQLGIDPKS